MVRWLDCYIAQLLHCYIATLLFRHPLLQSNPRFKYPLDTEGLTEMLKT